jgi:prolipoprotein diacylglyceryltransferase
LVENSLKKAVFYYCGVLVRALLFHGLINTQVNGLDDMTDLMNFAFLIICFGAGIGFVMACERLK